MAGLKEAWDGYEKLVHKGKDVPSRNLRSQCEDSRDAGWSRRTAATRILRWHGRSSHGNMRHRARVSRRDSAWDLYRQAEGNMQSQ